MSRKTLKPLDNTTNKPLTEAKPEALSNFSLLSKELGNTPDSDYYIGRAHAQNQAWALATAAYEKAAAAHHAQAMYQLGLLYQTDRRGPHGPGGIVKDIPTALHWLKKAAAMGFSPALGALITLSHHEPKALFCLGELYELEGIEVKKIWKQPLSIINALRVSKIKTPLTG